MAKPRKVRKLLPDEPAESAAVRILRTRLGEFYSHWPDPDQQPNPEELHNQRISGKRLRYSAETLRGLYPDHLALLIDLLKRQQDLLGAMQDVVTQRAMIASDLARRRRTQGRRDEIAGLEAMLAAYNERHSRLFRELEDIWRGMSTKQFRSLLKRIVSRPVKRVRKSDATAVEPATPG
ncbi:MAG: CHAD domain-containing protein [Acidobacteriota bacterium]